MWVKRSCYQEMRLSLIKVNLFFSLFFTSRVNVGVLVVVLTFARNPAAWPFIWNLFDNTFTWYYFLWDFYKWDFKTFCLRSKWIPLANGVFSLTWPASMQIYWNKRKVYIRRVQHPQDWFETPSLLLFHCFWTPTWRHVKRFRTSSYIRQSFPERVNWIEARWP